MLDRPPASAPSAPLPFLQSNGYSLDSRPHRLTRLTASDPGEPLHCLAERYEADGYLWLKGLLPRGEVLEFRRYFFARFLDTGLLYPDSEPVEGKANPDRKAEDGPASG